MSAPCLAISPTRLFAAYSASKFALRGFSVAMRRELKPYGVGVTYAAPRATRTDAAKAMEPLIAPSTDAPGQPARVAAQIWRAVEKDADSVYASGPERLYVLLQRLLPRLIDRTVAAQMADRRVQTYLAQRHEAARAPENVDAGQSTSLQESSLRRHRRWPQQSQHETHGVGHASIWQSFSC